MQGGEKFYFGHLFSVKMERTCLAFEFGYENWSYTVSRYRINVPIRIILIIPGLRKVQQYEMSLPLNLIILARIMIIFAPWAFILKLFVSRVCDWLLTLLFPLTSTDLWTNKLAAWSLAQDTKHGGNGHIVYIRDQLIKPCFQLELVLMNSISLQSYATVWINHYTNDNLMKGLNYSILRWVHSVTPIDFNRLLPDYLVGGDNSAFFVQVNRRFLY